MKNIDWIRAAILFAMAAVVVMLIQRFDQFQQKRFDEAEQAAKVQQQNESLASEVYSNNRVNNTGINITNTANNTTDQTDFDNEAPTVDNVDSSVNEQQAVQKQTALIVIENNVIRAKINPVGGDLVSIELLKHKVRRDSDEPIALLNDNYATRYVAQSGLIGRNGIDRKGRPHYQYKRDFVQITNQGDEQHIDLTWAQDSVTVTKRFTFKADDYLINIQYLVNNQTAETWQADLSAQIRRTDYIPKSRDLGMAAFIGAAVTTPEERYMRFDFDDIDAFKQTVDNGWVAMVQRYFVSAWIPDSSKPIKYSIRRSKNSDSYLMGYTQQGILLAPGEQGEINTLFYAGPKDQYRLRELAKDLDLTVDYGWLWWAAQPLYAVLSFIYTGTFNAFGINVDVFGGFPNWGVSIILLTIFVKLIFFKLSSTSFRSMARMRKLQPQMTALKERFGDDRQKMSQETMKLYKKEKVNPMGGCLPMLIQMPIFLALYWVFLESVELRHAPFFGWIQDLSDKDPWFILPLLYGASMFIQFKFQPTPADPMQAKVMQFMPLVFTIIFLWFPAGLVLYWTVNNIITIIHQWYITKTMS